ncbi:MAG: hypothetical protein CMJ39_12025 [Phycisphaerae bacterium]|nr:hypothetical protein [Phycisphaerae bacterium]
MWSDDDIFIKMDIIFDHSTGMDGCSLGHGNCRASYHGVHRSRQSNLVNKQTLLQQADIRIEVINLGRMSYVQALAEQRRRQQEVIADRQSTTPRMDLLVVEHDPPVITISNRPGARDHLLATDEQLRDRGVEIQATDRGGDITWHGPGQIVMYPILDLNRLGLRLHCYLRWLEDVVIKTLSHYGIEGHRDPDATGVWVGDPARKICAFGVRVSRWVTMHGLALNVNPDLSFFNLIVPCGLVDRGVTSINAELGGAGPTFDEVLDILQSQFREALSATIQERC